MKNSSQRKISFLVVLLGWSLFMSAKAQGKANPVWARDFRDLKLPGEMLKNKTAVFPADSGFYPLSGYNALISPVPVDLSQPVIPANIYYCQSGFFCKREWEFEKITHVAFRFRLGSLDYCNMLEGKQRPGPF